MLPASCSTSRRSWTSSLRRAKDAGRVVGVGVGDGDGDVGGVGVVLDDVACGGGGGGGCDGGGGGDKERG